MRVSTNPRMFLNIETKCGQATPSPAAEVTSSCCPCMERAAVPALSGTGSSLGQNQLINKMHSYHFSRSFCFSAGKGVWRSYITGISVSQGPKNLVVTQF